MITKRLHALHIGSEVTPYSKTGGLGDVTAALPRALAREKIDVTIVMPRYRSVDPLKSSLARRLEPLWISLGTRSEPVTVYEGHLPGAPVPVYLLDHPWFDRDGLYGDASGDYPDNGLRFALLARGALELAAKLGRWPDLVHAHDWQAGLAPYYARRVAEALSLPRPKTVLTIHNLAFQGLMPATLADELQLSPEVFHPEAGEYYGQLSFLKAGIAFADVVTTVSPRYAAEIQTPEHGAGFDGFLRARASKLAGILNGIDSDVWNPATDPHLPVRFDANDRSGKAVCKRELQREVGLPVRAQVPLIGLISRLTEQKGIDLIVQASDELLRMDLQLVVLGGSGDKKYIDAFTNLARRFPQRCAFKIAYDERLSHRIEAGSDFFLMPSRFEPCGLNQLYSYRYGTVPIVRAVGGLDDTVVDYDAPTGTGTGFKFAEFNADALVRAVKRAVALYHHPQKLAEVVERVMRMDFSWGRSASRYAELYQKLVAQPARVAA